MEPKSIFERNKVRNLVNWNSRISSYCQNVLFDEALDAFAKTQLDGFKPDEVSYASVVSACAQLGTLDTGNELHSMIIQKRIKLNQFILVNAYAKCGDLTRRMIQCYDLRLFHTRPLSGSIRIYE
ncbi:putative tetratricopeptide-like helical domain superfamily [Helianthus anomalus]